MCELGVWRALPDAGSLVSIILLDEAPPITATARSFVNRTDVDFASVQDIKATQTFHIAGADPDCEVYYVVQASRWQGVRSVTLFFEDSDGRDETAIHYIDFKGVASHLRREAVETVYETRPQSNELAGEADNFTHTSVL